MILPSTSKCLRSRDHNSNGCLSIVTRPKGSNSRVKKTEIVLPGSKLGLQSFVKDILGLTFIKSETSGMTETVFDELRRQGPTLVDICYVFVYPDRRKVILK